MIRKARDRGQPKVLVVDDEPDLLELLELTLSRMGLDTTRAQTVGEATHLLDTQAFDLCLTDMRLPDGEGLTVVEHITNKGLDVPVAVITAWAGWRSDRFRRRVPGSVGDRDQVGLVGAHGGRSSGH